MILDMPNRYSAKMEPLEIRDPDDPQNAAPFAFAPDPAFDIAAYFWLAAAIDVDRYDEALVASRELLVGVAMAEHRDRVAVRLNDPRFGRWPLVAARALLSQFLGIPNPWTRHNDVEEPSVGRVVDADTGQVSEVPLS